jgi:hypothetical protein
MKARRLTIFGMEEASFSIRMVAYTMVIGFATKWKDTANFTIEVEK